MPERNGPYRVVFLGTVEPPREVMEPMLNEIGAQLTAARVRSEEESIAAAKEADGIIMHGPTTASARVVEALQRCRVIARTGVGVDGVDVEAATRRGIVVCNAPGGNTAEVAEQTWGLILAVTRKLFRSHEYVRSGQWARSSVSTSVHRGPTRRLEGRTLGIYGFGRIGQAVAARARGFGMRVLAYDPFVPADVADGVGASLVERDELFRQSHVLTLHATLTRDNRHAIGTRELALMPRGSYLVNCARGGLVDHEALIEALRSGQLDGAGLDVTEPEPLPGDSPLLTLENVIITGHTAANSVESFLDVCRHAALNVAEVLQGRMPPSPVNPEAIRT